MTRSTILGSFSGALATNGGNIFFSTDTVTANGNDNNTISNNNIGPAGANLPTKLIYANGSVSTADIRNSGVVINNNNLYDYFSATVSVSGIHILSGNDAWMISNNRIYQTAARTFTGTALRYAGITINSTTTGLQGAFTITGNKIGFGAAEGTGTTTISGSTNEFRGIDAISVNATTPTSIQGNTVSGINQTTARNATGVTAGAFTGILLGSTAGRFDVGTTTGNNVGSLDGSSTIVINGTSATANTTPALGILDYSLSSNTISNNKIGSITIQGTGTTLGFRGIYGFTSGTQTETISNNTIANITDTQVGAYALYGIYVNSPAGTVTGNNIYNFSGASTTASGIIASGILVTNTSSTNPSTISQNNVYALTNNSGAASNSIYAIYCNFPALAANLVNRNLVRQLSVVSTATTSQMVGILPVAGSGTYQNNMVALGTDAAGTAITTGYVFYGMFEIAGTNNIYHNSVYLSGTGITAPGSTTFAFVSNIATTPTRNYLNNIFFNGRSNAVAGGSSHIALGLSGTATTNLNSNYNDLYAPGTDGFVGSFNGNAYPTLAGFQAATGTDANSISANPLFTSLTNLHLQAMSPAINAGTTADGVTLDFDGQTRDAMPDIGADEYFVPMPGTLALGSATYSVNENVMGGTVTITVNRTGGTDGAVSVPYTLTDGTATGGTTCGGTTDYINTGGTVNFANGQATATFTVQICDDSTFEGDETFNVNLGTATGGATTGTPAAAVVTIVDDEIAQPGTIQFSSATNSVNENAGTATITLSRTGGTDGAVSVPYTFTDGTATGGAACTAGVDYINTGGTVNFANGANSATITVQICDDTAVETDETFSINLGAAAGGATTGAPATTVVTILDNDTPTGLGGTVNVGAGETYTSLTNTGGAFDALNMQGATSNVTFNITSDLTAETGTVALNEVAGGFTVTIKPSGAARTISGSSTTGIIKINGADNVTIDGSLTGGTATGVGGDATLRNLTVQNTSTTATAGAVIAIFQGTNGALNDTVKNVNVMGQDPSQTLVGIHVGGNTVGASPTINNNNSRIENCSVQKAILGIFNNGITATPETGTVITRNDLSATGANRLRRAGIFFFGQDGIQVTENSIGGITTTESADAIGIIAGNQNVTTTTVAAGGVVNALISRNRINGVVNNGTIGYSAAGIVVAGGTTGANTISNNMITGVLANSTSPDLTVGIFVTGVVGSSTRLYYNSVAMTGDRGTVAGQIGSYAVAITGTNPTVELKDNIFYNTQTSGGGANAKSYAIGLQSTTFTNFNSNYNDFYTSGANAGYFRTGGLAATATDYPNLAAFRAATGSDANSLEVDPMFVDPTSDLHLQATSPVQNVGTPIPAVTVDFDGETRSATTPDIGADEIVGIITVPGTLQFDMASYTVNENAGTATITVTRTGGTDGAIMVDYATVAGGTATGGTSCTAGVDYINTSGTLTFADGVASQTFTVQICDDAIFENSETVNLALTNATGGATLGTQTTATLTIVDNDPQFTVSVNDAKVKEGDSGSRILTFTVTPVFNTPPALGGPAFSVNYATADGTATAGSDYVAASGTLTFTSNAPQTVMVTVIGDTLIESNEFFYLNLSGATNGSGITDNQGVGIIIDDDRAYTSDFDNDQITDFSVFRPSSGIWYTLQSTNFTPRATSFGLAGDIPVPGDYDGDGIADIAVYRPSTGVWYVKLTAGLGVITQPYGAPGDIPVQGDYDKDGKTDFAVFRPSTGVWYVLRSSDNVQTGTNFGLNGDVPVQGDYDGDAQTDLAVFRGGVWYVLRSRDNSVTGVQFGLGSDKPIVGDFDGDGRADYTVYRNGIWYVLQSLNNDFRAVQFGLSDDIPVAGDYDGDGTSDIAVFRPSTGIWYGIRSSDNTTFGIQWGQNGDIPIPSAYTPNVP